MALLTVYEVAERLGLSHQRIRQFIEQGRLPAQKVGRDWVITDEDLERADLRDRRQRARITPPEGTLAVADAAKVLGVSRQRAYMFIDDGRLEKVTLGPRATFVTRASVERLLEEREHATGMTTPRPFGAPLPDREAEG